MEISFISGYNIDNLNRVPFSMRTHSYYGLEDLICKELFDIVKEYHTVDHDKKCYVAHSDWKWAPRNSTHSLSFYKDNMRVSDHWNHTEQYMCEVPEESGMHLCEQNTITGE